MAAARGRLDDVQRALDHEVAQRGDAGLARRPRWRAALVLLRRVGNEQAAEQVSLAAAGAAFWLVISAFPTAIAAISVFGLVVSPERVAHDLGDLASAGPASLGSLVTVQLQRVAATDHAGLSAGLAVSLVLAVWSASGGVYNLDRAIRAAYGMPPVRYVEARGRAFVGALAVVMGLGVAALASAGVSFVLTYVPAPVVIVVGVPVLVTLTACLFAGLYRFSVGHHLGARNLIPGALASAAGLAVLIGAFAVYLHFSTRYTAVYGTLAGAVIGMIGTYLAVYVVLVGAVLNVQTTAAPDGGASPPGAAAGTGTRPGTGPGPGAGVSR